MKKLTKGKGKQPKSNDDNVPFDPAPYLNDDDVVFSGSEDSLRQASNNFDVFRKQGFICMEECQMEDLNNMFLSSNPNLDEDKIKKKKKAPLKKTHQDSKNIKNKTAKTKKIVFPFAPPQASDDDYQNLSSDTSAWTELVKDKVLKSLLIKAGFVKPTPIQEKVLHAISKDPSFECLMGAAPTGSGKTLSYILPILQSFNQQEHFNEKDKKRTVSVVLVPTRELALQIKEHIAAIAPSCKVAAILGGMSREKQVRLLRQASIVVATPGRLHQLLLPSDEGDVEETDLFKDDDNVQLDYLVLDEADRLAEPGHFGHLKELLERLAAKARHKMLFSATLLTAAQDDLARSILKKLNLSKKNFLRVEVKDAGSALPSTLSHASIPCEDLDAACLAWILMSRQKQQPAPKKDDSHHQDAEKTLIFVNSVDVVCKLTRLLEVCGIKAYGMHAHLPQRTRLRRLEAFASSEKTTSIGSIMIATDVVGRGIDLPSVSTVLHYHLPASLEALMHRAGRTARAGRQGQSIFLLPQKTILSKEREILSEIKMDRVIELGGLIASQPFKMVLREAQHLEAQLHAAERSTKERAFNKRILAAAELDDDEEHVNDNPNIKALEAAKKRIRLALAKLFQQQQSLH